MEFGKFDTLIRLDDGKVLTWSMLEAVFTPGNLIDRYPGHLRPGEHDPAFVRAILQKWGGGWTPDRLHRIGYVAEKRRRPGLKALFEDLAATLEQTIWDMWRMSFLESGVELSYRIPGTASQSLPIDDEIRERIWREPWVCRNLGDCTATGRTAREAIDTLMRMLILARAEEDH